MDFSTINPLWRLSDPLTVEQAAALIAGFDPNWVRFNAGNVVSLTRGSTLAENDGIALVQTALAVLTNAINGHKLNARLRYDAEPRYMAGMDNLKERGFWRGEDVAEIAGLDGSSYVIDVIPNWGKTTVERHDLIAWLERSGIPAEFFFRTAMDIPNYLDPINSRYSPKLAAAVRAWQAMEDENLRRGKSAKTSMEHWLTANYRQLGLVHKRNSEKHGVRAGEMNRTAISEVAKVANWEEDGGAPKTPSK